MPQANKLDLRQEMPQANKLDLRQKMPLGPKTRKLQTRPTILTRDKRRRKSQTLAL